MAVLVVLILIALAASHVMTLSQNQHRLLNSLTKSKMQNYYKARAGVIDANWRIRTNQGGSFTTAAYDPAPYYINLDNGEVSSLKTPESDVLVDIGPVENAAPKTGLREIVSTGIDS